jgi:hypothetical protein
MLPDITRNHADGEEAVAAMINTPQGKGKQVVDYGVATSSCFKKEKKNDKRCRDDNLVAVVEHKTSEGPIRRTKEGGSEWELIKILLEGDGNSNKMNTASNTRLRLTTQVGQAHVGTGVPLDLGTNAQPSDPRTQRKPNLESTDQHQSDR